MSYLKNASTNSTIIQSASKYIFYITIAATICLIILIFFHYANFGIFTIDSTATTIITIPGNNKIIKSAYETSTIPVYLSTKFKDIGRSGGIVRQTSYTISFDVYIGSSQNSGEYRVIFYNGKEIRDPGVVTDPSTGSALTNVAGTSITVDPSNLGSIQEKLSSIHSNICMYLSPDKNDLHLMYYRANVSPRNSSGSCGSWDSGTSGSGYQNDLLCQQALGWISEETNTKNLTIQNVPLQTPFRITLAVDPNFIEVYMNGDLVITSKVPNRSELYTYPVDNASKINFMGPPDFSTFCKVGNLKYWDKVLPSKSIRVYSSTPADKNVFTQA